MHYSTLPGLLAVTLGLLAAPAFAQGKLTLYCSSDEAWCQQAKTEFEKKTGIAVDMTRKSSGETYAQIKAESANPKGDIWWGGTGDPHLQAAEEGLTQAYVSETRTQLHDWANRQAVASKVRTVGIYSGALGYGYNEELLKKQNLPVPACWKDLIKPVYKGKIVMPHPSSSGTGFLDVTAWPQLFGEAEGWKYMDALHENIAIYQHSGSAPCRSAGTGEFPIGIGFEFRANQVKSTGAPIDLVFPKEGLGWDMEATAILKTTKNMDAAKALADFAVTQEANELYAKAYAVTALPGVAKQLPNIPANYTQLLVKNDFAWAAKNRDRILTEWNKRYNGKAAPK